jgi:uncharacterized protein YicC (UPF0701 family)
VGNRLNKALAADLNRALAGSLKGRASEGSLNKDLVGNRLNKASAVVDLNKALAGSLKGRASEGSLSKALMVSRLSRA